MPKEKRTFSLTKSVLFIALIFIIACGLYYLGGCGSNVGNPVSQPITIVDPDEETIEAQDEDDVSTLGDTPTLDTFLQESLGDDESLGQGAFYDDYTLEVNDDDPLIDQEEIKLKHGSMKVVNKKICVKRNSNGLCDYKPGVFFFPLGPSIGKVNTCPEAGDGDGSGFWGKNGGHLGMDLNGGSCPEAASEGKPIYAIGDGRVVKIKIDGEDGNVNAWGNAVLVRHIMRDGSPDNEIYSLYAHMKVAPCRGCQSDGSDGIKWKEEDIVFRGDQLGIVDSTGFSTGNHLHWGIKTGNGFGDAYTGENFSKFLLKYPYGGFTYYKGIHKKDGKWVDGFIRNYYFRFLYDAINASVPPVELIAGGELKKITIKMTNDGTDTWRGRNNNDPNWDNTEIFLLATKFRKCISTNPCAGTFVDINPLASATLSPFRVFLRGDLSKYNWITNRRPTGLSGSTLREETGSFVFYLRAPGTVESAIYEQCFDLWVNKRGGLRIDILKDGACISVNVKEQVKFVKPQTGDTFVGSLPSNYPTIDFEGRVMGFHSSVVWTLTSNKIGQFCSGSGTTVKCSETLNNFDIHEITLSASDDAGRKAEQKIKINVCWTSTNCPSPSKEIHHLPLNK